MVAADRLCSYDWQFPKAERTSLVRALGIEPERATRVHQNYWLKLAREGGQSKLVHCANQTVTFNELPPCLLAAPCGLFEPRSRGLVFPGQSFTAGKSFSMACQPVSI